MNIITFVCINYYILYIGNRNPSTFIKSLGCKSYEESFRINERIIYLVDGVDSNFPPEISTIVGGSPISSYLLKHPLAPILAYTGEMPDYGKDAANTWVQFAKTVFRDKVYLLTYNNDFVVNTESYRGYYWNDYIIRLVRESRCEPLNYSRVFDSRLRPLLLGGDGERRIELFNNLHELGALKSTNWSLSRPSVCDSGGDLQYNICKYLPNQIDRELKGALENSDKDITFPPSKMYYDTAFSIIPESIMQTGEYTFYFTEKVFKPIKMGHPFLHICVKGDSWDRLKKLGFKPCKIFNNKNLKTESLSECSSVKYATKVYNRIEHLKRMPFHKWQQAYRTAAFNKYWFSCRLRHKMQQLATKYVTDILDNSDELIPMCAFKSPFMKLKIGIEFCRESRIRCSSTWKKIKTRTTSSKIVMNSRQGTSCGFGTDLMERAGGVALGIYLGRSVIELIRDDEPMRLFIRPHSTVFSYNKTYESFRTINECNGDIRKSEFLTECIQFGNKYIQNIKFNGTGVVSNWDTSKDLHFVSHNSFAAFTGDIIGKRREYLNGYSSASGPGCISQRLIHYVSKHILEKVVDSLKQYDEDLIAIHIRMGDSAINRECRSCVMPGEPDILAADRIDITNLHNALHRARKKINDRPVYVASDTYEGYKLASSIFRVINPYNQTVHSTQIKTKSEATHLMVDFFSLILAKRIFCYGDSSISYNAASISNKVCEK